MQRINACGRAQIVLRRIFTFTYPSVSDINPWLRVQEQDEEMVRGTTPKRIPIGLGHSLEMVGGFNLTPILTYPGLGEARLGQAMGRKLRVSDQWDPDADVVLYQGDCRDLLAQIRKPAVRLGVTSPPYNVGKEYEDRLALEDYINVHSEVVRESHRVLLDGGSLCWEVGNYVENGEIIPLDVLLWDYFSEPPLSMKCRNRIIWAIPHGLHGRRRLSGRYEVVLWFTKGDDYYFDLDAIRVPSLWPKKKHFKGPRKGQVSSNPRGKNPSDVWIDISNVKFNHPEKTAHPCQFPEELVRRLVRALSGPDEWVLDPYLGSGTTAAVCIEQGRKIVAAEIESKYMKIARDRVKKRLKLVEQQQKLPFNQGALPASGLSLASPRASLVQSR